MKDFVFNLPTAVFMGNGYVNRVGAELLGRGFKNPMIITDKGIVSAGIAEPIKNSLNESEIKFYLFDEVEANPKVSLIYKGVDLYNENKCDSIIAIGGGSSIDSAKAVGMIISNGGKVEDYEGFGFVKKELPFIIAIPTTYGTGSEVSTASIVTNEQTKVKMFIGSDYLAPKLAIIDPEILVKLPFNIASSTGMDALTHAIESYVSKNANPVSDALNEYAIKAISGNITEAATTDDNIEATSQMVIASCMTAMAFNYTALGLVHSIAHSLGGLYNVPHGVANALLLPYVMEFNLPSNVEKHIKIAKLMGEDVTGLSDIDAAFKSIDAVKKLNNILQIPSKLSEIGIEKTSFKDITEHVFKDGNVSFNPRVIRAGDVIKILNNAY